LIPHVYDGDFDPELAAIPLATKGMRRPTGPLMSNSFGFGGNNCCLILERGPA
ncbi:MAG: beta-ketoacyl-[acyl-carrier-protein] synthase II, partial [Deltaproteobacteria bacterium]|nr:beta-ketoacyl-[acyl-carrier-protein] synthase II [Deltaproteobacteria bacterium]